MDAETPHAYSLQKTGQEQRSSPFSPQTSSAPLFDSSSKRNGNNANDNNDNDMADNENNHVGIDNQPGMVVVVARDLFNPPKTAATPPQQFASFESTRSTSSTSTVTSSTTTCTTTSTSTIIFTSTFAKTDATSTTHTSDTQDNTHHRHHHHLGSDTPPQKVVLWIVIAIIVCLAISFLVLLSNKICCKWKEWRERRERRKKERIMQRERGEGGRKWFRMSDLSGGLGRYHQP